MPWTSQAGTTGTDYSANAATDPIAGYVLLATIPAKLNRNNVEVQNQDVNLVQLVLDDGAGNNQTTAMLGVAGATGGQGGSWSDASFKGRVRVYGPSGTQRVMARVT